MYPLDYDTCDMGDVVARSLIAHPTLFRDAMHNVAQGHRRFAHDCRDNLARRIALRMAAKLDYYVALIDSGQECDDIMRDVRADFGGRVQLMSVAARLQVIPFSTQQLIAARESAAYALAGHNAAFA